MAGEGSSIDQLFEACDLDGSGFISEEELANICTELTPQEVQEVFRELDKDGDGKISIKEFSDGFMGLTHEKRVEKRRLSCLDIPRADLPKAKGARNKGRGRWDEETLLGHRPVERTGDAQEEADEVAKQVRDVVGGLDEGFGSLSCQEQVCELYQSLHSLGMTDVLTQFEDIVLGVIRDIRTQQAENERLEKTFKRKKKKVPTATLR